MGWAGWKVNGLTSIDSNPDEKPLLGIKESNTEDESILGKLDSCMVVDVVLGKNSSIFGSLM